jgi:mRNA interferase MazF
MKRPIAISDAPGFDRFDVVVVPFPFTDRSADKRRPALILSGARNFNAAAGSSVMAMITSADNAPWPLDSRIGDIKAAGLSADSMVRMKLFTLDHQLVLRKAGRLAAKDQKAVTQALAKLLS